MSAALAEEWSGNEGAARVVVVDNGSTDGSTDEVTRRFPDVEILRPGGNLGYGAAANRGVAATDTPWVVVGNPDLEVHAGALGILVGAGQDRPSNEDVETCLSRVLDYHGHLGRSDRDRDAER